VEETIAPWLEPHTHVAARAERTPGWGEWPKRVAALTDGAARVVIVAPTPLSHAAFQVCSERGVPCWVLVEPFMACGIGICLTCAVPLATENAYVRACVDGPVFPADRLAWEQLLPAGRPA
jgi:dihydroorotate dehydrogenase electron transfer subunit